MPRGALGLSVEEDSQSKHDVSIYEKPVAFLSMPNLCSAKGTKATSPLIDVFGGTPEIGT